ncbi:MAG: SdpI family protein [Lachnospira sp.]|nr:SdpI family protein [Lachnospira sp.]
MIKKSKLLIVITSLVTLLPILVGLILWNELPSQVATHFGVDGQPDGWSSKTMAVFFLPILILIIHWLCAFITGLDPKKNNISRKVYAAVLWICPIVSVIVGFLIYSPYLGLEINALFAVHVLLAIMFIVLGNYMPKCKQNYTIGYKISWTLEDEDNWNKTHRFAGMLWVIGGLVLLANLFLLNLVITVVVLIVLSIAPIVYSGVYYARKKK